MSDQNQQLPFLSPAPPVLPKGKKSRVVPILITVTCGFLLAIGSCVGLIATFSINGSKPMNAVFVAGIGAGVLLFVTGIIWGIVALIVHIFRS